MLEIGRDDFQHFMATIPGFAANVSQTLSDWLRGTSERKVTRHKIATLGLVRPRGDDDPLAGLIASAWHTSSEPLQVFTDRVEYWGAVARRDEAPQRLQVTSLNIADVSISVRPETS